MLIRSFGRAMLTAFAFTLVVAGAPAFAQDSIMTAFRAYDVPALPLAEALRLFEDQTGTSVRVDARLLEGKLNQPIHGGYRPEAALKSMLRGTGLTAGLRADGALEIVAIPSGSCAADPRPSAEPGPCPATSSTESS